MTEPAARRRDERTMEFSGRLEAFPPADLLQWAAQDRRTGCLVVRRGRREKRLYFQAGDLVACSSNDPVEHLGRRLLLEGWVTEEQLMEALARCARADQRLGTMLRDLGMLSEEQVARILRDHVSELALDLFLWDRGVFYFEAEMPREEEILPEPIRMIGLAMEGARRMDEHARLRKLFPHDGVILHRRGAVGDGRSPLEKRVIEACDGERDLRDLWREVGGTRFQLLEAARELCLREVLDIDTVGESGEDTSFEISVLDLLLEQAEVESEERLHLSVPLGALERHAPRWIDTDENDEAGDEGDLPAEAVELRRSFDGTRPLGELLASDLSTRERQLHLLILWLRRGRVSLAAVPRRAGGGDRSR